MEKENKNILYGVLGFSLLILAVFLFRILNNGLGITGDDIKYDVTGQVGDFIGGIIGTVFSGAGFYFLYVTLVEQRKAGVNQKDAFEKERFETRFFELIRLHKENVNEML